MTRTLPLPRPSHAPTAEPFAAGRRDPDGRGRRGGGVDGIRVLRAFLSVAVSSLSGGMMRRSYVVFAALALGFGAAVVGQQSPAPAPASQAPQGAARRGG